MLQNINNSNRTSIAYMTIPLNISNRLIILLSNTRPETHTKQSVSSLLIIDLIRA